MVASILLLALATAAAAVSVTSPTKSDVWTVGDSETITWNTVSSDQSTFNIYLSNMVDYPPTNVLLASDVDASKGSITVDGSKLSEGTAYTINFTNGTETEQIYAQSGQFNISAASSSSSASSSASSTSASASSSATDASTTGTGTASASGTASSAGTSASATESSTGTSTGTATDSSSSSTSTADSGAGRAVAGWVGAAAIAALAL